MENKGGSTKSSISSKESSPGNTVKYGNPMLSSTEIQLEANLDKIYDQVELLLDDLSLLDQLCSRANEYEEFPSLLFKFFYVHDKTHTLLRWALEKDINSLSPNELFRGETMATRLFYYQFFGDLGKRFLTSILATLLEEFAGLDHSVEIDSHRVTQSSTPVDTNANLDWLLTKLNEFVGRLYDSADNCPLGLRESFLFLKDVVGNKVENSNVFIASVIFLRLICPCLVLPEEYGVLDSLGVTPTEHGKRGLVLASKLLQSAANNSLWDNRPGSDKVNDFITQSNPLIVKFAQHLTDAEVIALGKKVIKASITPVTSEEVKQTRDALRNFMGHYVVRKNIKGQVDYRTKYQLAMSYYESEDWRVIAEGPVKDECDYHVSQLAQEESSIFVVRYWGRYKAPFELVKEYVRNAVPELTVDARVASLDVIEQHDANRADLHMIVKAVFPISSRDFVISRHNIDESPDKWLQLSYSIEREDTPVLKKYVRAENEVTLIVVERDPDDPEYTLYTYIYNVDFKGNVPAFLCNSAHSECYGSLAKFSQTVLQLGKEDDKKQKKDKKPKKEKTK